MSGNTWDSHFAQWVETVYGLASMSGNRRAAAHDICVAEDGFDCAGGAPDGGLQLSALTPVGQPQSAAPLRRPIKNVQRRARLRQRRQAMLQAPYCALPRPHTHPTITWG